MSLMEYGSNWELCRACFVANVQLLFIVTEWRKAVETPGVQGAACTGCTLSAAVWDRATDSHSPGLSSQNLRRLRLYAALQCTPATLCAADGSPRRHSPVTGSRGPGADCTLQPGHRDVTKQLCVTPGLAIHRHSDVPRLWDSQSTVILSSPCCWSYSCTAAELQTVPVIVPRPNSSHSHPRHTGLAITAVFLHGARISGNRRPSDFPGGASFRQ